MVLKSLRTPLEWTQLPDRQPGPGEIRVAIAACGVCRTDLHVVDGELSEPHTPIIPGHEIVGRIDAIGPGVEDLHIGERVGIPWLGHSCGACPYCLGGRENLCDAPGFTGYTRDGGYATAAIADARFAFPLGEQGDDVALAPLLCAGLIGWRALVMAGEGERLGLYGFGAAAHIVAQVARWQGRSVFAFTRPVRRLLYTANGIESLNYQLRKVTKARGHFPTDDAVVKLLWLAIVNIEDKRARERAAKCEQGDKHAFQPTRLVEGQRAAGWREALNELAEAYPGRIR